MFAPSVLDQCAECWHVMSQDSQSKLACLGEVVTGTTDASVSTNLYFKPTEQEEEEDAEKN